jgi:SAM-dependent methyltransferase
MNCRICGNAQGNKPYVVREMMFGSRETFTYFQCGACACLQIAEIPTDISKYYPANYYSFSPSKPLSTNPLKSFFRRSRDLYAIEGRGIIGRILYAFFPAGDMRKLSHAGVRLNSRILDVGYGTGAFLQRLRAGGFENLLGIDLLLEKDIECKNGLKILKKSIHDVEGMWDLVMFHHSLEHMPDQFKTLRAAAHLLADGGTCLVRIPTVSSYAWEHYRVNWVQIDAPRHFCLHSVGSLKQVAQKAGLCLGKVLYDSQDFQFWGSEQYAKDIPLRCERSYAENPERSIFSPTDIETFKKRAAELNRKDRGDQAAFYLNKQ